MRLLTLKTDQQKNFKLKHKEKKNGQHKAKHKSIRGNWDAIKTSNLYLTRILDMKDWSTEKCLKIKLMAKNSCKLMQDIKQ